MEPRSKRLGVKRVKLPRREATEKTLGGKELGVLEDQQEDWCGHGAGGEGSGARSASHASGLGVWISVSMEREACEGVKERNDRP